MSRRILLIVGLLIAWVQGTHAQTPPPAVTLELYADVRFPGEIFFEALIPLPAAEVAVVELVIQARSIAEPVRVSFPPEAYAFANEFVIARYTWAITPETQPPLFSTVSVVWRVTTITGQRFAANADVFYTDERLTWQDSTAPDGSITLVYPTTELDVNPASLLRQLNTVYGQLQTHTGANPAFRFLLFPAAVPFGCDRDADDNPIVIAKFADLSQTVLPCDVALAQQAFDDLDDTLVVVANTADAFNALVPVFVTTFYAPIWAEHDIPAWFQSGLEQFYLGNLGSRAIATSRNAIRQSGTPLALVAMATVPVDAAEKQIWQAQSYGMVLFIARQIGIEAMFALAQADDFVAAYEAAAQAPLVALIPDWQAWLFEDEAVRTYGYSIYAPNTLTPTFTPTATLTRTPRPPTETLTFTPDFSPTPRPTRTRIPPTATITPLPPQSFSLRPTAAPTPVPALMAASPIPGLTLPQVLVGGGVLLVVVILVGLLLRPRR